MNIPDHSGLKEVGKFLTEPSLREQWMKSVILNKNMTPEEANEAMFNWFRDSLRARLERIKTGKEYDAMVKSGDLSFLNYTPTQIYTKALDDVSNLFD